jgi:hypothetical protein
MDVTTSEPIVKSSETPHTKNGTPLLLRLLMVPVLGIGVVLSGGAVWGVAGFLLNKIYFIGAILIGIAVTIALLVPFKRTTLLLVILMFLPVTGLTALTVLFGDYVYLVLTAMREFQLGLVDAAFGVALQFVELYVWG